MDWGKEKNDTGTKLLHVDGIRYVHSALGRSLQSSGDDTMCPPAPVSSWDSLQVDVTYNVYFFGSCDPTVCTPTYGQIFRTPGADWMMFKMHSFAVLMRSSCPFQSDYPDLATCDPNQTLNVTYGIYTWDSKNSDFKDLVHTGVQLVPLSYDFGIVTFDMNNAILRGDTMYIMFLTTVPHHSNFFNPRSSGILPNHNYPALLAYHYHITGIDKGLFVYAQDVPLSRVAADLHAGPWFTVNPYKTDVIVKKNQYGVSDYGDLIFQANFECTDPLIGGGGGPDDQWDDGGSTGGWDPNFPGGDGGVPGPTDPTPTENPPSPTEVPPSPTEIPPSPTESPPSPTENPPSPSVSPPTSTQRPPTALMNPPTPTTLLEHSPSPTENTPTATLYVPTDVPSPTWFENRPRGDGTGGRVDGDDDIIVDDPVIGTVTGDPHLQLFSGLTVTYTGCGDHILIQDDDSGLMLQGRHCLRGGEGSSTCGIALRCSHSADVAELYTLDTVQIVRIGGKDVPISQRKATALGVIMKHTDSYFSLHCLNPSKAVLGLNVQVYVRESSTSLYFDVSVGGTVPSSARGLLGIQTSKPDESIVFRSGEVWNGGHGLDYISAIDHPTILDVQESWQVQSGESLFYLGPEQTQASCRMHRMRSLLSLKANDESTLEATELCRREGLTGVRLRTCVFDFVATNDKAFVKNAGKHSQMR
eukprot:CAMPEP_0184661148 /NCGR_PEP_ID=MMETSP0308-20130426/37131_1 /TAXON_ID=38269 /ORGANISM="Gloeochaete witrockiana, Strain SAG 46.84" /LENGTH=697 /DNA_ID=CAMNT_0027102247 /DNA_START=322 /DNA_END=2415 /DNA_ORIENTATION=+